MKCSYKKISALILALMMLLSVTGCTDNSASSLPGEKPSVYPFVNTLKEPDDNAMQAVEAREPISTSRWCKPLTIPNTCA